MDPTPPPPRAREAFAEGRRQVQALRADDLLPLPLHLTARILAAVGARPAPSLRVAWVPPRAALRAAAALLGLAAGALTVVGIEPLAALAGVPVGWGSAGEAPSTVLPFGAAPLAWAPPDGAGWIDPGWATSLADHAGGPAGLVALGVASLGLARFGLARVRTA